MALVRTGNTGRELALTNTGNVLGCGETGHRSAGTEKLLGLAALPLDGLLVVL